jgi:hypothetical protein
MSANDPVMDARELRSAWLFLVPYRRFSIDTALTADEAMRQVRDVTVARAGSKTVFRARRFEGARFKIIFNAFRGLRPVIVGEVTPTESGARATMTIRLNGPYMVLLVGFWTVLSLIAGGVQPAWCVVTVLCLCVAFAFEAKRAEALLRILLLPAPPEPASAPGSTLEYTHPP